MAISKSYYNEKTRSVTMNKVFIYRMTYCKRRLRQLSNLRLRVIICMYVFFRRIVKEYKEQNIMHIKLGDINIRID